MSSTSFGEGEAYFESFRGCEAGLPSRDMSAAMCDRHKGLACKALLVLEGDGAPGRSFGREVLGSSDFTEVEQERRKYETRKAPARAHDTRDNGMTLWPFGREGSVWRGALGLRPGAGRGPRRRPVSCRGGQSSPDHSLRCHRVERFMGVNMTDEKE